METRSEGDETMNKHEEGQMKLRATLARMQRQIAELPDQARDGACALCEGSGYALMATGEIVRCPECQCEVCGGLGFVRYEVPLNDPRFGRLYACPANCSAIHTIQEQRRGRIEKYAALPAEYAGLTFETFDRLPEVAREGKASGRWLAGAFVDTMPSGYVQLGDGEPRNWLVLFGPHGRGKTGLAAAIVNALTERGQQSLYIRLQDFIEAVQKRYQRSRSSDGYGDDFGADTAETVIEHAKTAPVLVMDEFDVPDRLISADKLSIVEKVVRYRHGNRLPTVLTANLGPDQFEERWGTTIASVVMARAHWAEMKGPGLRPVAAVWGDN
jgi:DNA replication protein DnaC